jgi:DNA-binding NtrC family response regulator
MAPRLLIVDDDRIFLRSLERALKANFAVLTAATEAEATQAFSEGPDVVLLDIRLDETDDQNRAGVELLKRFLTIRSEIPIVMTSAYGDMDIAVECMRLGASDFINKADLLGNPAGLKELRQRLNSSLERARLSRKIEQLEEQLERLEPLEIVGESERLGKIKQLLPVVAQDGYVTVLVRGETGTGKELVAHAIHRLGWRHSEPFVSVAIAALNPNLVESELFGHEIGAFTGATKRRIGYIEKAKGGCLFFDEIGDLPGDVQLKLLRFLEERRFSRVGSSIEIQTDVQIICATNRDLESAIVEGRIRDDLYFRLKSMEIVLPSLRERREDIPLLSDHFLNVFRQQGRSRIDEVTKEAAGVLLAYQWPGNIRELRAVLERANIYATYHGHTRIEKEDLPLELLTAATAQVPAASSLGDRIDLSLELARAEFSYIERALRLTEERKSEAWKLLGLNDRFALLRRAKSLLQTFPQLAAEFPTVQKLYGKD